MKRILCYFLTVLFLSVGASCAALTVEEEEPMYESITAAEAKQRMEAEENYIILDVRTEEEFAAGHIPGAILIPDYDIETVAPTRLPAKSQMLLIYCRSGRRSKLASETLAAMGYTNIYEFGGIIDWPYNVVTD